MRKPHSPSSKVIVQLDAEAHELLVKMAADQDRSIRDQARYLLKRAMGLLPAAHPAAPEE